MSTSPRESKRDLIIEAAIQVLSKKGYHHTKMEEIAVAAGIGKGTIYEYFSSKLQLLQEIMERSFHLYDHAIAPEQLPAVTVEEHLRKLIEGHFRFCQQNTELTRILFIDTEIIDLELRDWAWEKRVMKEQRLQAMLEAGIKRGEIRPLNSKLLTVMISGIFASIWIPVIVEGWEIDAAQAAEEVTEILMRGIRNP